MNVCVLAPHPDDETIGCGGALYRHARSGDRVVVLFLTSGELGLKQLPVDQARSVREREAVAAARILGLAGWHFLRGPDWGVAEDEARLATAVGECLAAEQPGLIYVPHPGDDHPDHRASWPMLQSALRTGRAGRPEVRGYEVWSPLPSFDQVVDVSRVYPVKTRALRAYASQLHEFDYLRAMRGLNQYRGVLAARCRYAEVFQELPVKD